MNSDDRFTFSQRAGLEPLPTQMEPKVLSPQLRAIIYDVIAQIFYNQLDVWHRILLDHYVRVLGQMSSSWPQNYGEMLAYAQEQIARKPYNEVLDFLEFIVHHNLCPKNLPTAIRKEFELARAAYRLDASGDFLPVSSQEEAAAVARAHELLAADAFSGAKAHLQQAGKHLTAGRNTDSIRESIHAVESVARAIEPSAELSRALAALEAKGSIHGALKKAFLALYGYSSDQQGIRHPLIDADKADVDESDALFMLGACASFITYVIGKAKKLGLKLNE